MAFCNRTPPSFTLSNSPRRLPNSAFRRIFSDRTSSALITISIISSLIAQLDDLPLTPDPLPPGYSVSPAISPSSHIGTQFVCVSLRTLGGSERLRSVLQKAYSANLTALPR